MAEEFKTEQTMIADRIYSEEVTAAIERFPETAPRWINKSTIPLKKNRSKKWFWAQVRGAATLHITSVQRVNSQLYRSDLNNHLEKISAAARELSDLLSPENDVRRHEIKYEVRRALDITSAGQFMLEFSDLQSRLKQLAEVTTARSIEKGRGAGSRPRNKVNAVRLLLRDLAFVWIDATGNLPSITSDHAGNKFQHFVQGLAPSFDIGTSRLMTPTTVRKVVEDLRQCDLSDADRIDK